MSDPVKPEPAAASHDSGATTTPAEPVAVEPVAVEPARAEVVEPTEAPVVVAEPVKKKRAVGGWSFFLGLLTGLVDIAFFVWVVVIIVGTIGDFTAGDFTALSSAIGAAGLVIIALLVFFGGFVTAGIAALLGLIALITGRGRVLGVFGLLFGLGALAIRIGLLSAGFSPDLG